MKRPSFRISIAYTPDTDDAFYYRALQEGACDDEGLRFTFHTAHIQELNALAEQGRFDVTAVSSVAYASREVFSRYRILPVGTSVGRGYGPVLAAREAMTIADLDGRRVAIAGFQTTGGFLMARANPRAILVPIDYQEMAAAVLRGDVHAAVLIHEELLAVEDRGLVRIADLGKDWCTQHGLPLPVGLNLVNRRFQPEIVERISRAIRASIRFGFEHSEATLQAIAHLDRGHMPRFVDMFANEDSFDMPSDVRRALTILFEEVADLGLGDPLLKRIPPPIFGSAGMNLLSP